MLTTVILDGAMGKKFGRKWQLSVNSPTEALRAIDANKPGIFAWIRSNLVRHDSYKVVCKYKNGVEEHLDGNTYELNREMAEIRFTPLVAGSGGSGFNIGKIVLGVAIFAAGFFSGGTAWAAYGPMMMMGGVALAAGGVVGLLTPMPKINALSSAERKDKTSYYFNGPVNTSMQGVPVQLIYGECMVGSHPVSVMLTVDEELA